jgi:preprotein translocase subunit SecD
MPTDIAGADVDVDQYTDDPVVIITFSHAAAQRFGKLTAQSVGETLPMFLHGRLLSCPVINEPIWGYEVQISGGFSALEAQELVSMIKQYAG